MNQIYQIYNLIFYQPIYHTLSFLYSYLKDFGLAMIFLTLILRIILLPLNYKASKEQEKISKIKKEIEEIERKLRGEEKTKEILAIYKRNKINPFFSFLSFFIQFPILIALYQVFLKGINQFDTISFKILDLSQPNIFLVFLAIFFQIFYLKLIQPPKTKENLLSSFFQNQMNFFIILLTFLFLLKLPSAISLYLLVSNLFSIFQKIVFHV
jgi:YidC/Oxa1 family membrane protein insertase